MQLFCLMGIQRLPNGNTLICNGDFHIRELPRGEVMMLEVTPNKRVVWKLTRSVVSKTLSPEDQNGTAVYRTSQARLFDSEAFALPATNSGPATPPAELASPKKGQQRKPASKHTAVIRSTMDPRRFAKMDANRDGQVSREEYIALIASGFEQKDKDTNGVLTPSEHRHTGSFKFGDTDKDGKLTRDEYIGYFGPLFDRVHDTNKDGVLSGADDK
jgi:hypothetical protein